MFLTGQNNVQDDSNDSLGSRRLRSDGDRSSNQIQFLESSPSRGLTTQLRKCHSVSARLSKLNPLRSSDRHSQPAKPGCRRRTTSAPVNDNLGPHRSSRNMSVVPKLIRSDSRGDLHDLRLHPPYEHELTSLVEEFGPVASKAKEAEDHSEKVVYQRFQMKLNLACVNTYALHSKVVNRKYLCAR